jgi:glycosyltransferase involved in cell wall biosynthesis
MKRLSLIICTRNRKSDLRRLLTLAPTWDPPGSDWEILVVDNGSSDGTAEMVAEVAARLHLPARVVREERPGHSRARNAGIAAAAGDLLAFTDDDVEPDPAWLAAMVEVARRREEMAFGGRVIPRWSGPPPAWLVTEGPYRITGGAVLAYDYGDQERECDASMFVPVGACMFFRQEVFERLGGFREDLGRQGTELISADDSEFFFRVRGAGLRVVYAPSVVLHHPVDVSRATRAYHRRWYWDLGRSFARWRGVPESSRIFLGFPGAALRQVALDAARYLGALVTGPREARLFRELRLRAALGQALEARRLRRAARVGQAYPRPPQ